MRRVLAFVLLVVAAASVPFVIALGRAEADPASAPMADVSWITGHWVGKTDRGQHIEEMWMPERDGLMLGSFRWERGNGRWLFEFMSLDTGTPAAPTPLTLRLKHFDRAFRGMEEKTASTTLHGRRAIGIAGALRAEGRRTRRASGV